MLKKLLHLTNEGLLRPFDAKIVRRSEVPGSGIGGMDSGRRVLFFHPPKCGGTSVHRYLADIFGGASNLNPFAANEAASRLGTTETAVRETVLAYEVQRSNLAYIGGHYPFSDRALKGLEGKFDLISILRDPHDRILSQYYYNRFKKNRNHYPIANELDTWLATPEAWSAATVFVRMFAGSAEATTHILSADPSDSTIIDIAASARFNLSKFTVVGVLESLEKFERAIQQRYGVKGKIGHQRRNPRPDYPSFVEQPPAIRERIEKLCQADRTIYLAFAP